MQLVFMRVLVCCAAMFGSGQLVAETVQIDVAVLAGVQSAPTLKANLRTPRASGAKVPAVVVLHSAGGIDGTASPYIDELLNLGIASLEVEMFARGGAIPFKDSLPYAYASLAFLAKHPSVDSSRIGILGFSYGGILAILSASADATKTYLGEGPSFAAHVSLYPICWIHAELAAGATDLGSAYTNRFMAGISAPMYLRTTDSPTLLLGGEKDEYDAPDSCPQFVNALPEPTKRRYKTVVYPNAYHGWDAPNDSSFNDPAAYKGRGGRVNRIRNSQIAARSKSDAIEFLRTALVTKP